jgi:hypothetical protein
MAVIFSYPIKSTPDNDDLILISDGTDRLTKQVRVSSLPSASGITLTTTGTSGVATLVGTVLNIPNYTTTSSGLSIFDEGSGVGLNIDKLDFIGNGVSAVVDNNDNTKVNITIPGGGGSPSTPANSVQFNNAGAFGGSNELKYDNSTKTLTVGDQDVVRGIISIAGGSSGAGELRLGDPGTSGGTVTLKGGNDHAASYTIKLPDDGPSANNKILESDASGNLTWINTPTGTTYSAGTGLALNGTTFSLATGAALTNLGGGTGSTFLRKDGTWATPQDANTNIANSNLQLDNNRTLDFRYDGADKSLTFINTNGGSKNLFKFEQTGGTAPYLYVGHSESAYEGYIVLEGNGSNRTGQVQFEDADGDYYTSFKAPNTLSQNIVYTLPSAQGAANSVLTNNGSGTLSWGTGTEEGSWTPTSANANTISNASGKYTKIGNTVFASFTFTMSGSTSISLSGLPFSGVYAGANKGTSIISVNNCASVQGQIVGGQMVAATSFTFNAYTGSGSGLPTKLQTTTSSMYQTAGGTYSGIIIYQTS